MTESAEFITENEVVEAVAGYLSNNGWEIVATCTTAQRGVDILAKRNGETLAVEAKGAGSATPESRRYGKPFTNNQKRSHVASALLAAARIVSRAEFRAAIALPADKVHKLLVEEITPALTILNVRVFSGLAR